MSDKKLVGEPFDLIHSMFIFFLIFATVGGLSELGSGGGDGNEDLVLVGATTSTIIYGLAMAFIGRKLPAKWWGEAVLVAIIFWLIWWLMGAISGGVEGDYLVVGAAYAVIAAVISGIIYEIFARAGKR